MCNINNAVVLFALLRPLFFGDISPSSIIIKRLIVKHAVAEAFKATILDLISELLTHTLIFGGFLASTGTIASAFFKSLLDDLYHFPIRIEQYLHSLPSFKVSYTSLASLKALRVASRTLPHEKLSPIL